ncbi:MAG: ADP-ribosylglycohydrolase family protein [Clostridia bacterium]|nr:ADP-ribosylglycohydrolase family protein [Clostridia bacterium]
MNTNVKIKLNASSFRDKVYACWIGKNIGGTMGGPYEGKREYLDVRGFSTAEGVVLPNDDLDLQLVWLHAVEKMGPLAINAATLGEFWLSFIVPHWNEYGLGKNNMVRGLLPPLSGDYENNWRDSNGAWIRTEVWACMAPGCPEIAAKYSIEDAKVDHGAGEGTYAAAFVAAMQSAAFVISDLRTCIDIGLSKIPAESRVADSVRLVMECFDAGKTSREARDTVLARNADIGDGWFEAPSNVAYTVLGLLYGKGDFKQSMIEALNCGDDTDCTGATVGATMGILGGMAAIPEDWRAHIGDDIVTISINRGSTGGKVPSTCTKLTNRVVAQTPFVLFANDAYVALTDGEDEIPADAEEMIRRSVTCAALTPYSMRFEYPFAFVDVVLDGAPDIEPMGEKRVTIKLINRRNVLDNNPYSLTTRWWLPDGFTVRGKQTAILYHGNSHNPCSGTLEYTLTAGESVEAVNRCVLEITAVGRPTPMYIPITLLG